MTRGATLRKAKLVPVKTLVEASRQYEPRAMVIHDLAQKTGMASVREHLFKGEPVLGLTKNNKVLAGVVAHRT